MERVTTDQMHRTMVSNIQAAQRRVMGTQEQLSSGYSVNRPSDDPVKAARIMDLMAQSSQLEQYQQNIQQAASWSRASEDAISQGAEIVQRVRILLLQGANDSTSATSRASIAGEVTSLVDSIKLLGNSKLGDEFIFAGTKTTTSPFSVAGPDTYQGDGGSIMRAIGPGETASVATTGLAAFGDGSSGLISVLRSIASNLTTNTAVSIASLRGANLQALDASLETLSSIRSTAGELQYKLDMQESRLGDLSVANMELLSLTRDTDLAEASAQFSQQAAALTAALKTGQQIVTPSLVDFMR
jgi:flagellar hook-associated protein 3 FlgL